ncbi:MAG: GNAT family N-acetyltransferase [Deltaproteobacteria bacterium]|nr:GNAT family N-acetyltransferase [Deltaproteobacteria bacterium]
MVYTLSCLNECWKSLPVHRQEDYLFQIRDLYRFAGWWSEPGDTLEKLVRIISGSHCFVAAIREESGMVLGMGRAISDRASDAYIQDIMVRPEVRRQAIASGIMKAIVERLKRDGMTWIGLIAKEGTQPFYRGLGFSEIPGAMPMLRKNESI